MNCREHVAEYEAVEPPTLKQSLSSNSMQFKTCFEWYHWYGGFKTIQQIIFFKYKGLQLGPWPCQAVLLGCLSLSSSWIHQELLATTIFF